MKGKPYSVLAVVFSLIGAAGCTGGVVVEDPIEESTLLVVNDSDFAIEELYITDVGAPDWGPNQLAGDVLLPDEQFLVTNIECSAYDAMLVAEDGVACELHDVDLCFDDATWHVTNDTCENFFRKAQEMKAARAQPAN
jgi:hypothetical protein